MTLEPAVRAHLDAMDPTPYIGADLPAVRALLRSDIDRMFTLFGLPGPEVHAIDDYEVPALNGPIPIRLYHPTEQTGLPVHILAHGGGWITGSIDELVADATARHRAVEAGCVVVLVEYRLAPEYPFPQAVYDIIGAAEWVRDNGEWLGVDPAVITLGGASAGANLVAAAVLGAPDLHPAALILEVPALDLTGATSRAALADLGLEAADVPLFTQAQDEFDRACTTYLVDRDHARIPLASPLFATDLAGFPETYVLTAELDPLRAEGEEFARRLTAAGVAAHVTRYPGALHGSPILTATWPTARRWHDDILVILGDVHRRSAGRHPGMQRTP